MSNLVRFATCSWKYDSWFLPPLPLLGEVGVESFRGFNFLEEYAKAFDSVEVDQWFWSLFAPGKPPALPKSKDVEEYAASTPDDFRFTIKAPNAITLTHYYPKFTGNKLEPNPWFFSTELWGSFLDSLRPLHPKTAAVILQFEYLNQQKMPNVNLFFGMLERFVKEVGQKIPIAIEIRNPNFLTKEFFTLLHDLELIPVFLQGYYMPPIFQVIEKFKGLLGDKVIIRLHGPDRSGIEEKTGGVWNKIVEPKDEEISRLVSLLGMLREMDTEVFVNVNNHYEGSAPLTINKIKEGMRNL